MNIKVNVFINKIKRLFLIEIKLLLAMLELTFPSVIHFFILFLFQTVNVEFSLEGTLLI